jgi:hypothetical protein
MTGGEGGAEARGDGLRRRQSRSRGSRGGAEEEEGRERIQGPVCKTQKLHGPCGNLIFPTDLEVF